MHTNIAQHNWRTRAPQAPTHRHPNPQTTRFKKLPQLPAKVAAEAVRVCLHARTERRLRNAGHDRMRTQPRVAPDLRTSRTRTHVACAEVLNQI